jgi:putative SOS response-associated peptidase YedK
MMCATYENIYRHEDFSKLFEIRPPLLEFSPLFFPNQQVPIVRLNTEGVRESVAVKWGILPRWWKSEPKEFKGSTFNAQAETIDEKASFREAFKTQRCLLPVSSFFEWHHTENNKKIKYQIGLKDQPLFAFAGVWERWERQDKVIESCTLLTTIPNDLMREVHNNKPRMPVIIDKEDFELWLDPSITKRERLEPLFAPYPEQKMVARPYVQTS